MAESWKDVLKSLIDCETRKERKKLAARLEQAIIALYERVPESATIKLNGSISEEKKEKKKKSKVKDDDVNKDVSGNQAIKNKGDDIPVQEEEVISKKSKSDKKKGNPVEEAGASTKADDEKDNKIVALNGNGHSAKKREAEGTSSVKKLKTSAEEPTTTSADPSSEKKRFQRVDETKALEKAIIMDNRYEAVFGSGGYGAKANEKLKTVRGKDFRHEKTKKKRGSYRGGAIEEDVIQSVDFDSD